MDQAKNSINIKANLDGFDVQFTLRDDDSMNTLLTQLPQMLNWIKQSGGTPQVYGNQRNGNGKPKESQIPTLPLGGDEQRVPVCRYCDTSDHMELIDFERDGKPRRAWKCQRCEKWHYDKNGK